MLRLIDTSVSKSNAKTVDAARAAWCEFKASVNADTETVDEATLCFFVVWMYNQVKRKKSPFARITAPLSPPPIIIPRRFSPDTATKYLGAVVRYFHRHGVHLDTSSSWALSQLKRAYRKRPDNAVTARQPLLPITNGVVAQLRPTFDFGRLAECCVYAVLTAGVGSLFRLGELTSARPGDAFPLRRHLSFTSPSEATLHLPNSKTDTTGRGVDVPLVCNGTATSSLHAMRQYLGVNESYVGPLDNGHRPLFRMPSLSEVSVPLSRGTFLSRLRQALDSAGLNPASYSGHSMRKGGAQSLFDAGVSTADIACAGRWSMRSTSIRLYRTITPHMRAHWARLAAAGSLSPPHRLIDFEDLHD